MRLLLDTHAVVWWFQGNRLLTVRAREVINNPENGVFVSAASAFEIALKHSRGKLPQVDELARGFEAWLDEQSFIPLDVTVRHAALAGRLTIQHKDPFDRLLIAQSILEDLVLISNERTFDAFGVNRLW